MRINGDEVILHEKIDLESFLLSHSYTLQRIAVELNGKVIPKKQFKEVFLTNEDILEVVHFVGGG